MKKVISIILLLTMSITAFNVFPVTAAAVTGKSGDWTAQAAETQEEIGAQEAPDTTGGSLVTVYFVNTYEWEDVYIYSWNPTTDQWPGRQMEFAGTVAATGEKVYKGQVDPSSAGFVFNNMGKRPLISNRESLGTQAGAQQITRTYALLSRLPSMRVSEIPMSRKYPINRIPKVMVIIFREAGGFTN